MDAGRWQILGDSEKVASLAQVVGAAPDAERHWQEGRWQAWEPVLFNQAHDLTSGTMVDKVYGDTIDHYKSSKEVASGLVQDGLDAISAKIDTHSDDAGGIALFVLNTLGWTRSDVAQAEDRIHRQRNQHCRASRPWWNTGTRSTYRCKPV